MKSPLIKLTTMALLLAGAAFAQAQDIQERTIRLRHQLADVSSHVASSSSSISRQVTPRRWRMPRSCRVAGATSNSATSIASPPSCSASARTSARPRAGP